MKEKTNKYLIVALLLGIIFHGTTMFYSLELSYDAYIHLFFAEHYSNNWFEPWNFKWYTGFTVMGYPPLVHQLIALLSIIGGLKFGLFTVALICVILFVTGVYRFSLLITGNRSAAGYASIFAVFSSSFIETLHLFGQLPGIAGIALLMHILPELYLWISTGLKRYLLTTISLVAITVTSHHVTPIFGMVFFIVPVIAMVVIDHTNKKLKPTEEHSFFQFYKSFLRLFKRIAFFGIGALITIIISIFPYWMNVKNNPISQVSIPHGSRDNFFEVLSSGLVFFLIPWGILLFLLPFIIYRYFSKRLLIFGISFIVLIVLGLGGTTPIPLKLLGKTVFEILTLDRFTLWATIMALPMIGEFTYRFVENDIKHKIQNLIGKVAHRIIGGLFALIAIIFVIFSINFVYFRPTQPQKIDMLAIRNFLHQDQHDQWRYLTLGFGDQMAWLSAQTNAASVDGNYHSARRLPELTTRAIERLENSKFKGIEGIGSLQQFLTVPEKYNLKFTFSNDIFYDPILYFCGWEKVERLENGIHVWEKLNVPPLPKKLPSEYTPTYLILMWGIIPITSLIIAFVLNIQMIWYQALKLKVKNISKTFLTNITYKMIPTRLVIIIGLWATTLTLISIIGYYIIYLKSSAFYTPKNVIIAYYDAIDFKEFEKAHTYLLPNSDFSLSQFLLEVSVSSGVLSSYAKLDAVDVEILSSTKIFAKTKVSTTWITPINLIQKTYFHDIVNKNGKWYIIPNKKDTDIPPNQLFSINKTAFHNHGRRRITTEQTIHEDVLKQPLIKILSAKLVKFNEQFMIIGELQNIDNIPADVSIKGIIYGGNHKKLASYNAKHVLKHKLLPKEISSFKIEFEAIAWLKPEDIAPNTFDPTQFTLAKIEEHPVSFEIQCQSNITTTNLYKQVSIGQKLIANNELDITLFNYGNSEVAIPQLLISYYDIQKNLIWVDHKFFQQGIRVQRKQTMQYKLIQEHQSIQLLNDNMEYCFVNGRHNNALLIRPKNHVPTTDLMPRLQKINSDSDSDPIKFLKIEVNNFVSSPK